ncbi:MAG: lipopolysaccharide heptosyltransferase II [Candidatus Omnitrophica bacterium]|nr:lipopolysaccharide heptosyltransferase II [Candidatus Omnitrophota bacterium]
MNILQILPELKSGGVETGTVDLARELIKQGHKAVVISNGGKLVKDLTASGAIHYCLPVHEKSPITVFSTIKKIRVIIEKENIQIVHARSRVPAISSFFAAYQTKVPFITTCHGYYSTHILSRVMGWGRYVIVASNLIARHMIKDFGVAREKIRLIPRGVDLERFTYRAPGADSAKKEYAIGIIGRITPIKGHITLIRAMTKVVRLMPKVKLVIIGDAPASKPKYRQELEVLVRRLSLSKYIHFLGSRHDMPRQMAKLDLVVMPSVGEEAFGRAIIEAQACGVPVIASKIGGIVDIIRDGENGILVAPRDWNELSDAIIKVLKDEALRQRLSKAGRMSVEKNFSLSQMYAKTIKVYQEALNSFKIVILKWSALGDIILSLPALMAIKAKFPRADIALVTSKQGRQILSRYPYVGEFFIYQNRRGVEAIREILALASELRRSSIDMVLDLQNNKKSHLLSFLSLVPRRIGYKSGKFDILMNETIGGARIGMAPVAHQFRLLKLLGISMMPKGLELKILDEEMEHVRSMLSEAWLGKDQVLVGLNCTASKRWQTKKWPAEKFAKLCDLLAQKKIRVVITGTKDDMQEARRLLMLTRSKPIDCVGKTSIMELSALIKMCGAFVTSDSAPMHLAAFLKVPFVALFGPTDPKRHIETDSVAYKLIHKEMKCSPCYKAKCAHIECMEEISPEEVATAVEQLLSRRLPNQARDVYQPKHEPVP